MVIFASFLSVDVQDKSLLFHAAVNGLPSAFHYPVQLSIFIDDVHICHYITTMLRNECQLQWHWNIIYWYECLYGLRFSLCKSCLIDFCQE